MVQTDNQSHSPLRASGRWAKRSSSVIRQLYSYRSALVRRAAVMISPKLARKFDASDAAQEAIVKVAREQSGLPSQAMNPANPTVDVRTQLWRALRDVIRNAVRRFRRARRTTIREVGLEEEASYARLAAAIGRSASGLKRIDDRDQLNNALAKLDEKQRDILLLRGERQLEFSEIAVRLGLSEENVKKRYQRAIKELKRILGVAEDEL